jgi:hypothetical protein
MTDKPPTTCPECKEEGGVTRLIYGGSGRGIMRRTGAEIKAGMASEVREMRRRIATDENYRANIVGESVYHEQVLNKEKLTNELVSIGKDASKTASKPKTPSQTRPKIKTKND